MHEPLCLSQCDVMSRIQLGYPCRVVVTRDPFVITDAGFLKLLFGIKPHHLHPRVILSSASLNEHFFTDSIEISSFMQQTHVETISVHSPYYFKNFIAI